MKKFSLLAILSLIFIFCSCSSGSGEMEYVPFKSTENGGWGLINAKGEVLYEGEFEEPITAANYGVFFARDKKGEWTLYSTKGKSPKEIASGFSSAGAFKEDLAPVVKGGEKITFINTKGEVVVTLDKAGKEIITDCGNFSEGIAAIRVESGKVGAVDKAGKVVVEPKYDYVSECTGGYMIAVISDREKWFILDKNGKEVSSGNTEKIDFPTASFASYGIDIFVDGKIPARKKGDDGTGRCGIMKVNGEWSLDPMSKIDYVFMMNDKYLIYVDKDSEFGLMKLDGEVIIRPGKYKRLAFLGNGNILAERDSDSERKFVIINADGEEVIDEYFRDVYFSPRFSRTIFAEASENDYTLYDAKGKEIKMKTRVYSLMDGNQMMGDEVISSEYVDVEKLISSLDIRENGIAGITLDSRPKTAIEKITAAIKDESGATSTSLPSEDPSDYTYKYNVTGDCYLPAYKASVVYKVEYPRSVADYSYSYDYYYGNYNYYFRDMRPEYVKVTISCQSSGIAKRFLLNLKEKIKGLGSIEDKSEDELVVKTSDGYLKVGRDDSSVYVQTSRGKLSIDGLDSDSVVAVVEEVIADTPAWDTAEAW